MMRGRGSFSSRGSGSSSIGRGGGFGRGGDRGGRGGGGGDMKCFNCGGDHFARECPEPRRDGGGRGRGGGDRGGRGGGGDNKCFNCGGDHFARECPEPRRDGGRGRGGDRGGGGSRGGGGGDNKCFNCGGDHFARECPEPRRDGGGRGRGGGDRGRGFGAGRGGGSFSRGGGDASGGKCFNCGGDHFARECPEPRRDGGGGRSESSNNNFSSGTTYQQRQQHYDEQNKTSSSSSSSTSTTRRESNKNQPEVIIFLVNAGLWIGYDGIVDAYDRGLSTATVKNESVVAARPDIVHQCLLGIFDSELGATGRCRVFIHTTKGKTIEVSPELRPPRTYERFKGLMATLFRDGKVSATTMNPEGGASIIDYSRPPLLQILQGSLAPIIPEGAPVIGITNSKYSQTIATPLAVAEYCIKNPVRSDLLRGGRVKKKMTSYFAIDCRDEGDCSEDPNVTTLVSLSAYPESAHVQAIRLCEGFQFAMSKLKLSNITSSSKNSSSEVAAVAAVESTSSNSSNDDNKIKQSVSKAVAVNNSNSETQEPQQERKGVRRQRHE